ncbi:hypothetical protein SMD44_p10022 (plasmid) [Streptomyces alboflavus]|uniref:Uncharacterized protein n=2 Tax=Streptomyces alboflavus TaxID=67267 RepID=A0A291W4F3_9ACTN|nr:hypothetical protein SMD44_p10022 [Streptomyces alboflavus]
MTSTPAQPGGEAASRSRILAEDGRDILMRRSLQEYAPSAHVQIFEAASALDDYRVHWFPRHLETAERCLERAMQALAVGTGEGDPAAWAVAVPYMVELRALHHSAGRLTAFDLSPVPPSRFTPVCPLRLEKISYEGHQRILDAARWLDRAHRETDRFHIARAQHAIHDAARIIGEQLPALSMPLWTLIGRYCAEIHATNLRARPGTSRT